MMHRPIPEWCEHLDHPSSHKYRLGKQNYCDKCDMERLDAEVERYQAWITELERGWLQLKQGQLIDSGMKTSQARIHAKTLLESAKHKILAR